MRTWYIIKNETTGKYIGIDRTSGGYPYDTEIYRAHRFGTQQEAKEYKDTIKSKNNWKLHELLIDSKYCGWGNEA